MIKSVELSVECRNLQEYRVRKAHHVIVHERDLLKYLLYGMVITLASKMLS